jgi:hypothetical protein
MKEDLRHSPEKLQKQIDKIEFGDGRIDRNAKRAFNRNQTNGGVKQKFLGRKSIFNKVKNSLENIN